MAMRIKTAKMINKALTSLKLTTLRRTAKRLNGAFEKGKMSASTLNINYSLIEGPEVLKHPDYHLLSTPLGLEAYEEEIDEFLNEQKNIELTSSQKEIILADQRNVRVIAGAGSGKSTTMVMRVIVMVYFLKIPISEITVFSFTKKSVLEFREKLLKFSQVFPKPLTEKQVKACVVTFHGKLLNLASACFGPRIRDQVFENIKTKEPDPEIEDFSSVSNIDEKQSRLLEKFYSELYQKNKEFKSFINELKELYIAGKFRKKEPKLYELEHQQQAHECDEELTRTAHIDTFLKPFKNLCQEEQTSPYEEFCIIGKYVNQVELRSNLYFKDWDLHIIFKPSMKISKENSDDKEEKKFGSLSFNGALTRKVRFLDEFDKTSNIHVIYSPAEAETLAELLLNKKDIAPQLRYALRGERMEDKIWNYMYKFAYYVESTGLSVEDFCNTVQHSECKHEEIFLKILTIYWSYFDKCLRERGLYRYNQLFTLFSKQDALQNRGVLSALRSTQHLIIDEFQDISPLITRWIQGILRCHYQYSNPTSLMAVGDDWQCIYGWRGSSPHILTEKFDNYFTCKKTSKLFQLNENFRSTQSIIDLAELALDESQLGNNDKKSGLSKTRYQHDHSFDPFIFKEKEKVAEHIANILREIKEKCDVLILARSNNEIKNIKKLIKEQNIKTLAKIDYMTIHQSKGLQAKIVFLIEDFDHPEPIPVKAYVHSASKFPGSHQDAQIQEMNRLVYVAITRAKEQIWLFPVNKNENIIHKLSLKHKDLLKEKASQKKKRGYFSKQHILENTYEVIRKY